MNSSYQEALVISRAIRAFVATLSSGAVSTDGLSQVDPTDPPLWPYGLAWGGFAVPIAYDPVHNVITLDA